jgi:hypothetical protein
MWRIFQRISRKLGSNKHKTQARARAQAQAQAQAQTPTITNFSKSKNYRFKRILFKLNFPASVPSRFVMTATKSAKIFLALTALAGSIWLGLPDKYMLMDIRSNQIFLFAFSFRN